jgi:hypothetical protein
MFGACQLSLSFAFFIEEKAFEGRTMGINHAELLLLTAAEIRNLVQKASDAVATGGQEEARRDSGAREPGDFYWHEDTPPMPLWQGVLIALRHMAGMKI